MARYDLLCQQGTAEGAHALLTKRMDERLSAPIREGLDALVAVDDDQPHSPLNRNQGELVEPVGRQHEAAAGEAGAPTGCWLQVPMDKPPPAGRRRRRYALPRWD